MSWLRFATCPSKCTVCDQNPEELYREYLDFLAMKLPENNDYIYQTSLYEISEKIYY